MESLTKEEYEAWLQDPATKKVLKELQRRMAIQEAELSHGNTVDEDNIYRTAMLTVKKVGKIEGINEIFHVVAFV